MRPWQVVIAGHLLAAGFAFLTVPAVVLAQDSAPQAVLDRAMQNLEAELRQRQAQERARLDRFQQRHEAATGAQAADLAATRRLRQSNEELQQQLLEADEDATRLHALLSERTAGLSALRAVVADATRSAHRLLERSPASAQLPGRLDRELAAVEEGLAPTAAAIEGVWQSMLQEMVEQGRLARFAAQNGATGSGELLRAGAFNIQDQEQFLRWSAADGLVPALAQTPLSLRRALAAAARDEILLIDSGQGAALDLMSRTPGWQQRLQTAGPIGYLILVLGGIGLLVSVRHLVALRQERARMLLQAQAPEQPGAGNPLGRLLLANQAGRADRPDDLALRLDEVILREANALRRSEPLVRLLAAIAPLLGLLGTVTGMIATFRAITVFGSGDPVLMADGISQALLTTWLGLGVAVCLALLHAWMSSISAALVTQLDTTGAGLLAQEARRCSSA